jgi:phage-related protein
VAIFNFPISYGTNVEIATRSVDIKFGDGYELSSEDGINVQVKRWSVRFTNILEADADAITDFYYTYSAATTPFTWVDPDGATGRYKWRSFNKSYDNYGTFNITGVFEQVFQ